MNESFLTAYATSRNVSSRSMVAEGQRRVPRQSPGLRTDKLRQRAGLEPFSLGLAASSVLLLLLFFC
jgi:hypothetical protein